MSPLQSKGQQQGHIFGVGRMLLGRSESCDFILTSPVVSSIHAVLEITPRRAVLYDMNSRNGTFVNGERIVTKAIQQGDKVKLGDVEFEFGAYQDPSELPPVLSSLAPSEGSASVMKTMEEQSRPLPTSPIKEEEDNDDYVVHPLSSDPDAEYSEYIFEDEQQLYPIFKYPTGKNAIEIIILYKDRIYSVDYLADKKGKYTMSGAVDKAHADLEFPYLGANEKVNFITISKGTYEVARLPGYEILHLSDNEISNPAGESILLEDHDIIKLTNGDLEVYVRKVAAPPKVKAPPFLRMDKDLRRYLLLVLLFILLPLIGLTLFEVDEEKEEQKAPERIAKILYRPKELTPSTKKTVSKTENKPKVVQKDKKRPSPKKAEAKPKPKPKPINTPKVAGVKAAKKVQKVKKVTKPKAAQKSPRSAKSTLQTTKSASRSQALKRTAPTPRKTVGRVDVYKSSDFKTSINSLRARGGSLRAAKTAQAQGAISGTAGVSGGFDSRVKTSDADAAPGSLTGATTGKLDVSKGAEGLSTKRGVYSAGIPSETVVLGSIDPDIIRKILRDHLPQFRSCYQRELDQNRNAYSGIVQMDFTIAASGHVNQSSVGRGSNAPASVRRCIAGVLRGIQFPRPRGGGTVDVRQPLNLSRQNL